MKRSRIKVGAVAVVATASLVGLTACSPGEESSSDTIRVATSYDDAWSEPLRVAAADYEEANPGVTVEIEAIPYEEYQAAFQTQLVGGSAADVLFLEPPAVAEFSGRGFLEPLDSYLDDDSAWADGFSDGILDATRSSDGKQYLAPWSSVQVVVAYRDGLYAEAGAEAPETWDEWMETNQALADAGQAPLNVSLKGDDASTWWLLTNKLDAVLRPLVPEINLIAGDGFSYDPDDLSSTVGETYTTDELYVAFKKGLIDPATSDAYRAAVEQVIEISPFLNDDTGSTIPEEVTSSFAANEVPQLVAVGASLAAAATEIAEAGETSDIKSFNLPTITEDDFAGLTAGGQNPLAGPRNGYSVNAAAANKEGAVDFVKYITSADVATKMYAVQAQGDPSTIKGVTYPDDSVIGDPATPLFAEISPYGFGGAPTFDTQDFDEFNAQWQKLLTGNSSVDEFLQERSASNLAALERNLALNADSIDQGFIDEQLGN